MVSAQCGRQLGISYVGYEGNPPICPPISHFALMNSAGLRLALAQSTFDKPISDRAWARDLSDRSKRVSPVGPQN
jgi:hypothetical protein